MRPPRRGCVDRCVSDTASFETQHQRAVSRESPYGQQHIGARAAVGPGKYSLTKGQLIEPISAHGGLGRHNRLHPPGGINEVAAVAIGWRRCVKTESRAVEHPCPGRSPGRRGRRTIVLDLYATQNGFDIVERSRKGQPCWLPLREEAFVQIDKCFEAT